MNEQIERDKPLWPDRLESDEKYLGNHTYALENMVRSAGGPHYSKASGAGTYTPENHYHSYTTLMVSRLMHDNPRVRCSTRRPGTQMETAEAIRHGMNRWVRDVNLREIGQLIGYDFCYMWGMAMVRQIPNRHMGKTTERWIWTEDGGLQSQSDESLWPAVYRIPQPQVIIDSRALTTGEAEYMGHIWYGNTKEILAEAKANSKSGWNVQELQALADSSGSPGGSAAKSDPDRETRAMDPPKHEIEFATVWVPGRQVDDEHGPDQGYHGAMLTLARSSSSAGGKFRDVKDPEPYYGPPSGPYQIFGAYKLPNKLLPLGPLVAVEGQIRELNRQARSLSRSSERHKRIILFDEKHKKTALRLKKAQHDFFVGIPGFETTKFAQAEIGGVTDSQYKAVAYHQDRLNRISAMDEAQSGNVTGLGTATEHSIANEASATRVAFLKQQFSAAMSDVLKKVAWFLYHDDRVVFPLGEDAAEDLGLEEPWFHGGDHDKGSDAGFDDLELEIEAYSMQRADEASVKAQTQAGLQWIIETSTMRAQLPFLKWDAIDELASQVYGMPDLAGLVDNQAAMEMGLFEEGAQAQQPRLQRDVGTGQQYGRSFGGGRAPAAPSPKMQSAGMSTGAGGMGVPMGGPQ